MSLLPPEYTCSSSDDEGDCGATKRLKTSLTPATPQKRALYLPEAIQRLLETGIDASSDEDDDEYDCNVSTRMSEENFEASALDFLPKPVRSYESALLPEQSHSVHDEDHIQTLKEYETSNITVQQPYMQHYSGERMIKDAASNRTRARLNERALERALEKGQFDALSPDLPIKEVQGPDGDSWKPTIEMIEAIKKEEVNVAASFWNARVGGRVSSIKPTRLQRQKHQLNQLAFDARAREQDLLNKKGLAIKTRAETQAKYGW
uniref:Uncharacterized protein AlNc14C269G9939 n=1 Tax=Albugo laibachii Nc14 TaxID=890382 RepID=F0WUB8_9STRA|nr:conserved hypothetical protein [Albugo laibachii Nc14]|eukprot:CCA24996.1 conserved hypothetical protein [Albugo laibachii Nc14]